MMTGIPTSTFSLKKHQLLLLIAGMHYQNEGEKDLQKNCPVIIQVEGCGNPVESVTNKEEYSTASSGLKYSACCQIIFSQ